MQKKDDDIALQVRHSACDENDISVEEIITLLGYNFESDDIINKLKEKNLISERKVLEVDDPKRSIYLKSYYITQEGVELLEKVIFQPKNKKQNSDLHALADKMREVYPKGKMPGTSYYYKGTTPDIYKRLCIFFQKYGDNYKPEQIIAATKKYVDNLNGDYTYLKLLKYFIMKNENKNNEIIQTSLLAETLENEDDDNENLNNNDLR